MLHHNHGNLLDIYTNWGFYSFLVYMRYNFRYFNYRFYTLYNISICFNEINCSYIQCKYRFNRILGIPILSILNNLITLLLQNIHLSNGNQWKHLKTYLLLHWSTLGIMLDCFCHIPYIWENSLHIQNFLNIDQSCSLHNSNLSRICCRQDYTLRYNYQRN